MRNLLGVFALLWGCSSGPSSSPTLPTEPPLEPVAAGPSEIGHLPVPPMSAGATHAARLFYSYRPSDDGDGRKPLFVFMNGGPGFATSAGLLSWGIGPSTLQQGAAAPVDNPDRWTRFSNLLFLDERHAGFSYGLRPGGSGVGCSPLDDAAEHLLAVLEFLAAHPQLKRTRVVLVGESYGGMRVVSMLKLLRDPSLSPNPALNEALAAHGDPAQLAAQFADAVLIQPLVFGDAQYKVQQELIETDPAFAPAAPGHAGHDVRKTTEELNAFDDQTLRAFADAAARERLLGGKIEQVPTMLPSARTAAFRDVSTFGLESESLPDQDLSARLGPLGKEDRYFAEMAHSCVSYRGAEWIKPWFAELLRTTRFFVTNARYDRAIVTPAIFELMRRSGIGLEIADGRVTVQLPASESDGLPATTATVRFQPYESGHAVAQSAAGPFAADVAAWLTSR